MTLCAWLTRLDRLDRRLSARIAAAPLLPRRAAQIGAHAGDLWLWALVSALAWPRQDRATRLEWLAGLVAAAAATYRLKQQTRRPRPVAATGLYGGGADVYGFPSGHAARWGVILVWAARGGKNRLIPALFLALWTGWSRVRLGIHTLGDVVAGLALGVALAQGMAWLSGRFYHRSR
jgi:membrane-associated phospholipid phosphatase